MSVSSYKLAQVSLVHKCVRGQYLPRLRQQAAAYGYEHCQSITSVFGVAVWQQTLQCGDDNNIPRTDWPLVEAMQTYIYP